MFPFTKIKIASAIRLYKPSVNEKPEVVKHGYSTNSS